MSKRNEKRYGGNGLGHQPHHSAMGHATKTKSKAERIRQAERKQRQRGWTDR